MATAATTPSTGKGGGATPSSCEADVNTALAHLVRFGSRALWAAVADNSSHDTLAQVAAAKARGVQPGDTKLVKEPKQSAATAVVVAFHKPPLRCCHQVAKLCLRDLGASVGDSIQWNAPTASATTPAGQPVVHTPAPPCYVNVTVPAESLAAATRLSHLRLPPLVAASLSQSLMETLGVAALRRAFDAAVAHHAGGSDDHHTEVEGREDAPHR